MNIHMVLTPHTIKWAVGVSWYLPLPCQLRRPLVFMNYLRGAVSAISAPYQYYKDINPSTLTGAIDVIVISRPKLVPSEADPHEQTPAPDGEKEYACSPFHVRFGKWQVLRPADKKVRSPYWIVLTHVECYTR